MTNIEKYNETFCISFEIEENILKGLSYKNIPLWDSVGHMTLITNLEDAFDILIDAEDIMSIKSYEEGKKILSVNYNIEF